MNQMGIIRTLLALAVTLSHAGVTSTFKPMIGPTAVQAFYVISGFYITLVFNNVYASNFSSAAKIFWLNRYCRLAPLYILTSATTLAVSPHAMPHDLDFTTMILLLLSHVSMIGQDVWVFLAYSTNNQSLYFLHTTLEAAISSLPPNTHLGAHLLIIPQGWSIGVEMWFYIIAPAIVGRNPKFIAFIILTSISFRFLFYAFTGLKADPWNYRFFPFELAIFLLGSLSYHAYSWIKALHANRKLEAIVFASMVTITLFHWYLPGGQQEKRYAYIALLAMSLPFIFNLSKHSILDRWIGDLSYPIYITHMLILSLTPGAGGVAVSILIAIALVIAIEYPADALRRRLTRRWGQPQPQGAATR